MKGIAHFISGIAAASFIPAAVQQSAQGAWVLALAGAWQQYAVRFDTPLREIAVRIGPVVTTSQVPVGATSVRADARAKFSAPMNYTYDAEVKIDIFSGPSFRFERKGDAIAITFLPWHRAWSHSLTVAIGLGVIVGLLWGWLAGVVVALGYAVHVLEDQLGAMGSNLLWPLTRGRFPGLNLIRSGDAVPNFLTVWTACALTLFNLDRFADAPRLPAAPYLLGVVALPIVALVPTYIAGRNREKPRPVETLRQADLVAETQETEV